MPLQLTEEIKLFLNELIEKKFTSLSILEMIALGVVEVPARNIEFEEAEKPR